MKQLICVPFSILHTTVLFFRDIVVNAYLYIIGIIPMSLIVYLVDSYHAVVSGTASCIQGRDIDFQL